MASMRLEPDHRAKVMATSNNASRNSEAQQPYAAYGDATQ